VLRWDGDVLTAANTGEPLTAEGVAALASLRASAKRTGATVGRFGVGFAAVAAVCDEVTIASTTGAVQFDRAATLREAQAVPELADELAARDGRVPLLRLPWPSDARPASGRTTEVRLVVRSDARDRVAAMLGEVDAALLLVLPGLAELGLPERALRRDVVGGDEVVGGVRYRVVRAEGDLDAALLADRPVEERTATRWSVLWAVPVDDAGVPQPLSLASVVHAPTPTDDPLSLPALMAASLPLAPDRRRVQPGPLTEAVLQHAAQALAALLPRLADDPARLMLVPGPLGVGEVDAVLGRAVLAALTDAPVLAGGRRARDAVVLDAASPQLVGVLEDVLPGLLPAPWSASRWATPLRTLGVRRLDLAGVTEVLAGLERSPPWWRTLYAALPPDRDALGALPVPLTDGRLAPSPRGLLVSDAIVDLSPLGVRVVHPDAAQPLLLRLGAIEAEPRALLEDPRVRAAVEAAADDDDPSAVVEAVLALVGAAAVRPGELPWLARLPLRDSDGEWRPAGELLLPDGPLAHVVDRSAGFGVVASDIAPDDVLAAVGALRGFAVVPVEDADGVDGLDDWLASLPPGEEPGPVVRDLDLVRDDAWPAALDLLDRDGLLALPYVRWWLSYAPVFGGEQPRALRSPEADPLLHGLFDEATDRRAAALGVRSSLAEVLDDDPDDLLDRLADTRRHVGRRQVRAVHAALAAAAPDVEPPIRVRAVVDGRLEVVAAEDAVVVDRPDLLARIAPYAAVPVPLALAAALADVLDLPLASEVVPVAELDLAGAVPWRDVVGDLAPASGRVLQTKALNVSDAGGEHVATSWVAVGDVDVVTDDEGLARALAWRLGAWSRRHELLARWRGQWREPDADLDEV
jgi:uncharacterized protein YjeT (DUF2065 family)